MIPPKRHIRVFRIAPGRWAYDVLGSEHPLPFRGEARTWRTAYRRGTWWLQTPELREPGWSGPTGGA